MWNYIKYFAEVAHSYCDGFHRLRKPRRIFLAEKCPACRAPSLIGPFHAVQKTRLPLTEISPPVACS